MELLSITSILYLQNILDIFPHFVIFQYRNYIDFSINQSINQSQCSAKGQVFHCKLSILHSTLFSAIFFIFAHSLSSDIFFYREPSSHLPFLLERPSAGSSLLASSPVNSFSSSLSIPALFFLLPLFLAQLHFYFACPFYTFHPSPYPHLKCFQRFCSFRRTVQDSAPYNATLHTKHFTSLFLCYSSKDPQKMLLFLLKGSFAIAILCFTF